MTVFISQGRYTHTAPRNLIDNPEDRWENARKRVKAARGTLLQFYLT